MSFFSSHRSRSFVGGAFLFIAASFCCASNLNAAGDLEKLSGSLKLVPADASFYMASLRNKEQLDIVKNSKAYKKILELPYVQMGLAMYTMQTANPQSELGKYYAALKNPDVAKALSVLADMGSNEIFIFGDKDVPEFIDLLQEVQMASNYGPIVESIATGQPSRPDAQVHAVISELLEHGDDLKLPNMAFGFKVTDKAAAEQSLGKLEAIVTAAALNVPQMKSSIKKEKIGKHEYCVVRFDGKMIPWSELPLDDVRRHEENEGDFDKLVERIKAMKLVVAFGLRDDYVVVSIGSSTACIEKLDSDKKLISNESFKPLAKFSDERVISVGYAGTELVALQDSTPKLCEWIVRMADAACERLELSEDKSANVISFAKKLGEITKKYAVKPGDAVGVSYMTSDGIENYGFRFGTTQSFDFSKPSDLVKHFGEKPLAAFALRFASVKTADRADLKNYALKLPAVVETLAIPYMPEDQQERGKALLADLRPLYERLVGVTYDKFTASVENGEFAFILDSSFKSKQMHREMPEVEEALPYPTPALAMTVKDAKLLKEAAAEYVKLVEDFSAVIRKHVPEADMPEFKIPAPEVAKTAYGESFAYHLPKESGFDDRVVPHAALSDNLLILSFSADQSAALMKESSAKTIEDLTVDKPRAAVGAIYWSKLFETSEPWIAFGLAQSGVGDSPAVPAEAVIMHADTILAALETLKYTVFETYEENGMIVSRSKTKIEDVKE